MKAQLLKYGKLIMIIQHVISSQPKKNIITVSPEKKISEAAKLLADNKIGALPVTSDGKNIVGIISERDIIRKISTDGNKALDLNVADAMTKSVCTCTKMDTLKSVITKMNAGRFRHMPVIEKSELVNFISISDLVLAHLNEVEFENDALKGSVTGNSRRQSN